MKVPTGLLVLVTTVALSAFSFAASETVKGAKKDIAQFKQEMAVKLESLEKQIAELKAKGGKAKSKTVAELEGSRDAVKAKLSKVSEDGKDGWESLKKNLADSMNKLNDKVQKALKD